MNSSKLVQDLAECVSAPCQGKHFIQNCKRITSSVNQTTRNDLVGLEQLISMWQHPNPFQQVSTSSWALRLPLHPFCARPHPFCVYAPTQRPQPLPRASEEQLHQPVVTLREKFSPFAALLCKSDRKKYPKHSSSERAARRHCSVRSPKPSRATARCRGGDDRPSLLIPEPRAPT